MIDAIGLVHMNGRVYDPELGRFLSADPFVQDATNLQSWNRYSYVLNNPLSYTDPSGYFFKKLFKSIGKAFKKVFKAVGSIAKKALQVPLIRSAIQIVACFDVVLCAPVTAALNLASGGSITDAIKAGAFAFVQQNVWTQVGGFFDSVKGLGTAGLAAAKGAVHGVVGGALSIAQGGNFKQGFIANAIGGATGVLARGIAGNNIGLHTAIVATAGCAAASATGGKCANGAATAAFANLYNFHRLFFKGVNSAKRHIPGVKPGLKALGKGFFRFNSFLRGIFSRPGPTFSDKATARKAFSGDLQRGANRFFKGASKNSTDFQSRNILRGGKRLEFFTPANTVGYGKRFVQDINRFGKKTGEFKINVGPNGNGLIKRID